MDGMFQMLIWMVPIFAIMYFLMIRPEQKRKKQTAEMRNALQVGDDITTIGGHMGKVVRVQDDFVVFENGEDRVRHKVAKWAIATKSRAAE